MFAPDCYVVRTKTSDAARIDRVGRWCVKHWWNVPRSPLWMPAAAWYEQIAQRVAVTRRGIAVGRVRFNPTLYFDRRRLVTISPWVEGPWAGDADVVEAREALRRAGWGMVGDLSNPNVIAAGGGLVVIDFAWHGGAIG